MIPNLRALEADTNRILKLVLTELDTVAAMQPEDACDPYELEERKKRIKRQLWEHHRALINALQGNE